MEEGRAKKRDHRKSGSREVGMEEGRTGRQWGQEEGKIGRTMKKVETRREGRNGRRTDGLWDQEVRPG